MYLVLLGLHWKTLNMLADWRHPVQYSRGPFFVVLFFLIFYSIHSIPTSDGYLPRLQHHIQAQGVEQGLFSLAGEDAQRHAGQRWQAHQDPSVGQQVQHVKDPRQEQDSLKHAQVALLSSAHSRRFPSKRQQVPTFSLSFSLCLPPEAPPPPPPRAPAPHPPRRPRRKIGWCSA